MPLLLLAACAGIPQKKTKTDADPVRKLYETGRSALLARDYPRAIATFRRLVTLHPGHALASQTRMELAYGYFKAGDTFSAIAEAERFIRDYPRHDTLDYLFYLRGLAAYEHTMAFLDRQSATQAEDMPPLAELTLQYFKALVERFPDSKYSEDARARLGRLRETLASLEVQRAKTALARGDFANATLLARAVMEKYPLAPASRDAAALIEMGRRALGGAPAMKDRTDTPDAAAPAPRPPVPPPTAETSAPRQEKATDAAMQDGRRETRGKAWLLAQPGSKFTLQLLGTGNLRALRDFIRRHGLEDQAAYFTVQRDGHPWHTLLYGVYSDRKQARAAIASLPQAVQAQRPWPRRLAVIQDLIHDAR